MIKYKKLLTFILLLSLNLAADTTSVPDFRMLEANLISGLVPHIEDGYGVAFRDFNGDDYPDIYLVCFRNLNRLLINNGGIIPFIDRTIYSGLGGYLMSHGQSNMELGASTADFNNDGFPDIFLSGWGKTSRLFQNLGNVSFKDVTQNLNLHGILDANFGLWLDADNNGQLDIYISDAHQSNRLFMNQGGGFFSETVWTNSFIDSADSRGSCAADFDNDGDSDIYVCNRQNKDYLLKNDGTGIFYPVLLSLPTLKNNYSTNSAATGDIDNDGDLDLVIAANNGNVFIYENISVKNQISFINVLHNQFKFSGEELFGILIEDFNNDGWLDCFFTTDGQNRLYLNNGRGGFYAQFDSDGKKSFSAGSAAADLDLDGDLDIFVSNRNTLSQIYLNPTNDNNAVTLRLTGVTSNRDALGSKVYFYVGNDTLKRLIAFRDVSPNSGYLSSSTPVIHFGMGDYSSVDAEIIFPSGKKIIEHGLKPGDNRKVSEFPFVISEIYYAADTFFALAVRPAFWINGALILLFLALVYLYVHTGLKRYQMQTAAMTGRLIIWFLASIAVFISMRNFELLYILIMLNTVSIAGIVLSTLYSEHLNVLRKKRDRFRKQMQFLSDQMINIHKNEELYNKLIKTMLSHENIKVVYIYIFNNDRLTLHQPDTNYPHRVENEISIKKDLLNRILNYRGIIRRKDYDFANLFVPGEINVVIPIKREESLFSLVCLSISDSKSLLNQQDLDLILAISNQTAIAVENNNYIDESARLVKQLTEAKIRQEYLAQVEETNKQLDIKNKELTRLFKELQEKEAQLIHSEKMASLGQLVAGISHELNNPISFIYANSRALMEYLEEMEGKIYFLNSGIAAKNNTWNELREIISELKSIIQDNIQGSSSVKDLVINLKNFSRLDQAEWKDVHLVSGIESSLKILHQQINDRIKIIKKYDANPLIHCNPGQLNQVFLNIISNAIQALKDGGRVTLHTFIENKGFHIRVKDTGVGISKENLTKIFDPFFTTKDVNKGTGLGLSISYAIIQKHGGNICVESALGKGTSFTIKLPLTRNSK